MQKHCSCSSEVFTKLTYFGSQDGRIHKDCIPYHTGQISPQRIIIMVIEIAFISQASELLSLSLACLAPPPAPASGNLCCILRFGNETCLDWFSLQAVWIDREWQCQNSAWHWPQCWRRPLAGGNCGQNLGWLVRRLIIISSGAEDACGFAKWKQEGNDPIE